MTPGDKRSAVSYDMFLIPTHGVRPHTLLNDLAVCLCHNFIYFVLLMPLSDVDTLGEGAP